MKLKNVNKNKGEKPPVKKGFDDEEIHQIDKSIGENIKIFEDLKHPIEKGDMVTLKDKYIKDSPELGKDSYEVDKIFLRNFPDMGVWILYLKRGGKVKNPYLAHHFKLVSNGTR